MSAAADYEREHPLRCSQCDWSGLADAAILTHTPANNGIRADCPECYSYIKFVPRGRLADVTLFFGKHKGERVADVAREEPDYLRWLLANARLSERVRQACKQGLGDE